LIILIFILGLLIGSFINSYLWRYQTKHTFKGRSLCPRCKHQLAWYDNIPLVSWILLTGKCRYCKKPISVQYPLVELLTGLVFAILTLFSYPGKNLVTYFNQLLSGLPLPQGFYINLLLLGLLLFIASILIIIAVYDLKTQEIPNGFNLSFVLASLLYSFALNVFILTNPINFFASLLSGLAAFFFFYLFVFFSKETWMGGGDAKLAIGIGMLLGPLYTFLAILIASWMGAIVGLGLISLKKADRKTAIPFGPFLVLATFIALLAGSQIVSFYARIILKY
jgi:prepilin signal peptidase PulO-like enzyme (type II secretory pathway)